MEDTDATGIVQKQNNATSTRNNNIQKVQITAPGSGQPTTNKDASSSTTFLFEHDKKVLLNDTEPLNGSNNPSSESPQEPNENAESEISDQPSLFTNTVTKNFVLRQNDVVFGANAGPQITTANTLLWEILKQNAQAHSNARQAKKRRMERAILEQIKKKVPGVRFIRRKRVNFTLGRHHYRLASEEEARGVIAEKFIGIHARKQQKQKQQKQIKAAEKANAQRSSLIDHEQNNREQPITGGQQPVLNVNESNSSTGESPTKAKPENGHQARSISIKHTTSRSFSPKRRNEAATTPASPPKKQPRLSLAEDTPTESPQVAIIYIDDEESATNSNESSMSVTDAPAGTNSRELATLTFNHHAPSSAKEEVKLEPKVELNQELAFLQNQVGSLSNTIQQLQNKIALLEQQQAATMKPIQRVSVHEENQQLLQENELLKEEIEQMKMNHAMEIGFLEGSGDGD